MVRLPVFENRPAASKLAVGLNGLEDGAQDTAARKPQFSPTISCRPDQNWRRRSQRPVILRLLTRIASFDATLNAPVVCHVNQGHKHIRGQ